MTPKAARLGWPGPQVIHPPRSVLSPRPPPLPARPECSLSSDHSPSIATRPCNFLGPSPFPLGHPGPLVPRNLALPAFPPGPRTTPRAAGPGVAVLGAGCTGCWSPRRTWQGGLGRNPTPVCAPPPAQMARARAGPGPRFRAQVTAARGGAGARGPRSPRPINRQAETPSHQSRLGPAAPSPPRSLFPIALAALRAARSLRPGSWPLALQLPARADPVVCTRVYAGLAQAHARALRAPPPGTGLPVALHTGCPQLPQGPRESLA